MNPLKFIIRWIWRSIIVIMMIILSPLMILIMWSEETEGTFSLWFLITDYCDFVKDVFLEGTP